MTVKCKMVVSPYIDQADSEQELVDYNTYPDRESASRVVLEFLAGQDNPQFLPASSPREGLEGYSAFYVKDGVERGLWASWPLVPGRAPLVVKELIVKNLEDMDLPEGKFYSCDNPLALRKGFVVYDWEAGVATVQEISVSELKRKYPSPLELVNSLTKAAEANRKRDYENTTGHWFVAMREAMALGKPVEWVKWVAEYLEAGKPLDQASLMANEDLHCQAALFAAQA